MIIEGKAHSKYLKPKKGVSIDLRDHCLSVKLEADQVKEVGFLTYLYHSFSIKGARVVIYRGKKRVCEYSR